MQGLIGSHIRADSSKLSENALNICGPPPQRLCQPEAEAPVGWCAHVEPPESPRLVAPGHALIGYSDGRLNRKPRTDWCVGWIAQQRLSNSRSIAWN